LALELRHKHRFSDTLQTDSPDHAQGGIKGDLVAILDLLSREVLSWKLFNTLDARFCLAALAEAIARWGFPAIISTDQGGQSMAELKTELHRYFRFHNVRYHQSLHDATPTKI